MAAKYNLHTLFSTFTDSLEIFESGITAFLTGNTVDSLTLNTELQLEIIFGKLLSLQTIQKELSICFNAISTESLPAPISNASIGPPVIGKANMNCYTCNNDISMKKKANSFTCKFCENISHLSCGGYLASDVSDDLLCPSCVDLWKYDADGSVSPASSVTSPAIEDGLQPTPNISTNFCLFKDVPATASPDSIGLPTPNISTDNFVCFKGVPETASPDGILTKSPQPTPNISDSSLNMISREELYAELDRIERKRRNIIIFGLQNANLQDMGIISDLFHDLGVKSNISTCYRVGKLSDPNAESHRPRPLVVVLGSIEERSAVLNLAKLLKNQQKWKGVFIAEDLTKHQYALEKICETSLKNEAARRNLQSNDQGLRWRVVGGRGTRRIIVMRT